MAIRLIEMHRILKDTGSLYLHCDPTMSHYLKIILDCIFGEENFINEIAWCYNTQGKPKKGFAKKHDIIFFYAKDKSRFTFNKIAITPSDIGRYNKTEEKTGRKYQIDGKGYKYYLDDGRYCPDFVFFLDFFIFAVFILSGGILANFTLASFTRRLLGCFFIKL